LPSKWLKLLAGASSAAMGTLGYMHWVEPRWLRISRLTISIPNLPPAFDGYQIAHLSDLHLGVQMTDRYLPTIVEKVNSEHPDLIAITGDFSTGERDGLDNGQQMLSQLHAPDGVWGVLGNHDYHVGADAVMRMAELAGIGMLCNQHHLLTRGTDCVILAGIDDVMIGAPHLPAALHNTPANTPIILLAHEPDFARTALAYPNIMLQLSGHTHGGQIRPPMFGPIVLPKLGHIYYAGAYRVRHMALYVSSGIGTGRFTLRLNCRPEIALIQLRCGNRENNHQWPTKYRKDAVL